MTSLFSLIYDMMALNTSAGDLVVFVSPLNSWMQTNILQWCLGTKYRRFSQFSLFDLFLSKKQFLYYVAIKCPKPLAGIL